MFNHLIDSSKLRELNLNKTGFKLMPFISVIDLRIFDINSKISFRKSFLFLN
jgi:hypothetical protein